MRAVKSLLALGMMLIAAGANAAVMLDLTPYLGADYSQIWMRGSGSWGSIFPRRDFSGGGIYLGSKFHRNFGIEFGYDASMRKKRDWTLEARTPFFNGTTTEKINATTTLQRHGVHIDLVGFLHITECLEFIGNVGYGWLKPRLHISTVMATNRLPSNSTVALGLANISGKGRGVMRLGVGLSYMVTEMVGVRTKFSWENTKPLRLTGNEIFNNLGFDSRGFKSSTAVSLGAFLRF